MDDHTHNKSRAVDRAGRVERGASLVEYALLVALIALVCIGAVEFFGGATSGSIDRSASSIFIAGP